jgi:hypothetical protein
VKVEVLVTQWSAEGQTLAGGVHEIGPGECPCGAKHKSTKAFLSLVAAAEDAGSIKVSASKAERAELKGHVQTQADGEKAYAEAQRDGRWHEGNYDAFMADVEAGLRDPDEFGVMPDREIYVNERKAG